MKPSETSLAPIPVPVILLFMKTKGTCFAGALPGKIAVAQCDQTGYSIVVNCAWEYSRAGGLDNLREELKFTYADKYAPDEDAELLRVEQSPFYGQNK